MSPATKPCDDLASVWDAYAAENPAASAQARRAFYAGALAVLELAHLRSPTERIDPKALVSEVMAYGRAIGTAAERAG